MTKAQHRQSMGSCYFWTPGSFEEYLMACRVPCGLSQVAPSPVDSAARSPSMQGISTHLCPHGGWQGAEAAAVGSALLPLPGWPSRGRRWMMPSTSNWEQRGPVIRLVQLFSLMLSKSLKALDATKQLKVLVLVRVIPVIHICWFSKMGPRNVVRIGSLHRGL